MKLRIFEQLQRKARMAVKSVRKFQRLERRKATIIFGVASGKIPQTLGKDLMQLIRLRQQVLILKEMNRLSKPAPASPHN